MKTVAIIGADGQLGSDLLAAFDGRREYSVVALTLDDTNICDFKNTRATLRMNSPHVVINTAAYNRVDDAEEHPDEALLTNAAAVHNLARVCKEMDAVLMHFSTDYVFGGWSQRRTPFGESDLPFPQSVYSTSKLAGEYLVRAGWHKHFVVRTCGLYGVIGRSGRRASRNFVEIMLRLAEQGKSLRVVDDQQVAPTATQDLAAKVIELLETHRYGLYHLTNSGQTTWYGFAQKIFELAGLDPELTPVSSEEYGARAGRPAYSILDNGELRAAGLAPLRPWQEALAAYMEARQHAPAELEESP